MEKNTNYQWFIITAIGGQEDSIANALKEKLINFGYQDYVKDVKVLKETIVAKDDFTKNDPSLPQHFKNTKTTKWEALQNGNFRRIKTKVVNRFPGYIFINMKMDPAVWYAVRNTQGVLGFVGSSGKGSLPIPITMEEYVNISENNETPIAKDKPVQPVSDISKPEKKIIECNFKIGQTAIIKSSGLNGEEAKIMSINLEKGTAVVEYEFFGRINSMELSIEELELKK